MNNPNKEEIYNLFSQSKLGRDFRIERHGGNKCLLKYGPDGDIIADTSNNVKNILEKFIIENECGFVPRLREV